LPTELQWLAAIVSVSIIFWSSWISYRRFGDANALQLAKQKYGKNNNSASTSSSSLSVRRMGVLSELWQIMYETNNSPIIHAFEYGPNSGYHLLSEFWQSFTEKYVNWRSVPVKINGRWFWREIDIKDFHIGDHCKRVELTSINGDTQKALANFVNENNMNKPFDAEKPHWEAYYVSFTDVKNEAYGYGRFHHSIGDGVLLNRIFEMEHNLLWEKKAKHDQKVRQNPINKNKQKKSNNNNDMWTKLKRVALILFNLLRYTPWSLCDLISLFWFESAPLKCGIHCDYYGKDTYEHNVQRKFNIATSDRFNLTDIKTFCKSHGDFTINDFGMAIFCEAVHEYIFKYVCNSDEKEYGKIVKLYGEKLYLRFFTIFNMRSLIDSDLERLSAKYAAGLAENDLSTVPIRLPCGDMPFMQRFTEIHNLFHKLKNGPTPIITSLILKVGHFLFGLKFVNMILGRFTASKCTFLLSNLMGPRQHLLSGPPNGDGEEQRNVVWNTFNGTNPTHTPLSCGIMSYVDSITFTMIADQNSIKDPNQFMECLNAVYARQSSTKQEN